MERFDITVIGAGPAGVCAAVEAARCGMRVLLVENSTICGGMLKRGGLPNVGYFFARGKAIIGGIGWELAQECAVLTDTPIPPPDYHSPNRPGFLMHVEGDMFALLAEEKFLLAGGTLAYGSFPVRTEFCGHEWYLQIAGKGIMRDVVSAQVIDCSGDASFVRLAGGQVTRSVHCQPGTLEFHLTGYDPAKLDPDVMNRVYREALSSGELQEGDFYPPEGDFMVYLQRGGGNLQHLFGADSADAFLQGEADIAGRQRLLRMLRFLRRQPGLEHCKIERMAETSGIRESWRIVGLHTITEDEYLHGMEFPDAVALSYYFIDVHNEHGIEMKFIDEGAWPEIPLRALIPVDLPNCLVAGKMISCDDRAYSALRVMGSCMGMGQAAGAAASAAVRRNVSPQVLDPSEVRAILRDHKAILPDRYLEI